VNDLKNWINALAVNVNASLVQTTDSSHFALMIQGSQTGLENAVTYTGLDISSGPTIATTPGTISSTESATVTFNPMTAGQTLTLAGLTFKAGSSGATSAQVANAFATVAGGASAASINLAKSLGNAAGGSFTAGTATGWASSGTSGPSNNIVTFTSALLTLM